MSAGSQSNSTVRWRIPILMVLALLATLLVAPAGGAAADTGCEPGFYFDGISKVGDPGTCEPAPPGSFVAAAGATSATPCPTGRYQPLEGQTSCLLAPAGTYVDTSGAIAAPPCPLGTYQPFEGQTSCLLADPGFYVDQVGATAQTVCPEGTTTDFLGATSEDQCLPIGENADPVITVIIAPTAPVAIGTPVEVSAPFTDADSGDTHTCTIDWGDNTTSDGAVAELTCAGSHSYTAAGVYTVTVTVTDNSDGSDSESFEYVVVYDPNGGFVTGGGWIDSPAGAYVADPDLTGKATFGFVAKYKKGANVPDGNTQFQFKAGDLHFHSSSYEWLVVAGSDARFKGVGTINGIGNYGFMITATDSAINGGGVQDAFRIKIWDIDNGDAVVYDNQPDEADDSTAATAIGGGSIVIHTAKK